MAQYKITKEINGGFNNPVCFATHRITSQQVVIKEIESAKYSRDAKKHLISEGNAHALCSANNLHVIDLVEEFSVDGNVYLVTKRANSGNLCEYQASLAKMGGTCLQE